MLQMVFIWTSSKILDSSANYKECSQYLIDNMLTICRGVTVGLDITVFIVKGETQAGDELENSRLTLSLFSVYTTNKFPVRITLNYFLLHPNKNITPKDIFCVKLHLCFMTDPKVFEKS